jgi:hypothetical protein
MEAAVADRMECIGNHLLKRLNAHGKAKKMLDRNENNVVR